LSKVQWRIVAFEMIVKGVMLWKSITV
jgi:hypothetical protein